MTDQAAHGSLPALFRNVLAAWSRDEIEDMLPAVVVAYSPTPRPTVTVRPLVMMSDSDGASIRRPAYTNIPVYRFGGGGYFIQAPIKAGDVGWLKACDRDISLVMQRQGEDRANTRRTHDFSDSVFFPDVLFGGSSIDPDGLVLQSEDGSVSIVLRNGQVDISAPVVNVDSPQVMFYGDVTVQGTLESYGQMIGAGINFNTHRHGGVEPGGGTSGGPIA